jgi:hypothetical protein
MARRSAAHIFFCLCYFCVSENDEVEKTRVACMRVCVCACVLILRCLIRELTGQGAAMDVKVHQVWQNQPLVIQRSRDAGVVAEV